MIFILLKLFFALLIGHAVCDYPLQGDFLSRGKNRFNPTGGVPWWICLTAHAAIHAGAVWLITGRWWLGLAEFCVHAWIDDRKCAGKLSVVRDQALHVICKAMWVLMISYAWVQL